MTTTIYRRNDRVFYAYAAGKRLPLAGWWRVVLANRRGGHDDRTASVGGNHRGLRAHSGALAGWSGQVGEALAPVWPQPARAMISMAGSSNAPEPRR